MFSIYVRVCVCTCGCVYTWGATRRSEGNSGELVLSYFSVASGIGTWVFTLGQPYPESPSQPPSFPPLLPTLLTPLVDKSPSNCKKESPAFH